LLRALSAPEIFAKRNTDDPFLALPDDENAGERQPGDIQ
jgi:hypothetical protein